MCGRENVGRPAGKKRGAGLSLEMRDPIFLLLVRAIADRENEIIAVSNSGTGISDRNLSCGLRKMIPERVKRVKPQAASHCGGAISLGTVRR